MSEREITILNISLSELKELMQKAIQEEFTQLKLQDLKPVSGDQYLSKVQTANLLKISLPTLTKYVKKGVIPAYHIGCNIRFRESEVKASLEIIQKKGFNLKI